MIKINKEFIGGMVVGFGSGVALKAVSGKENLSWKGLVKGAMRTSMSTYEKVKDGLAKTKENFEDMAAEVRSEIQAQKESKSTTQTDVTSASAPEGGNLVSDTGFAVTSE